MAARSPSASASPGITILLDEIAGPDNMGALLRVAAGVGARRVVAVRGCVDPWAPKAMRAAMGAHFRIPIESDVPWDLVPSRLPRYSQVSAYTFWLNIKCNSKRLLVHLHYIDVVLP